MNGSDERVSDATLIDVYQGVAVADMRAPAAANDFRPEHPNLRKGLSKKFGLSEITASAEVESKAPNGRRNA
jgi:hypothetical protein